MSDRYHERLVLSGKDRHASDRSFGIVFAVFFGVLAVYFFYRQSGWALPLTGLSAVFALAAFLFPTVLRPLNWLWGRFGMLLHRIVSPIILAVMFFGIIMPIGLLMRILGQRPLRLNLEREAETYWVEREPGPKAGSLRRQF